MSDQSPIPGSVSAEIVEETAIGYRVRVELQLETGERLTSYVPITGLEKAPTDVREEAIDEAIVFCEDGLDG